MNKFAKLILCAILAVVLSLSIIGLVACNNEHTHSYSDEWASDASGHWHVAICEHTQETTPTEKHTFENGVCSVCKWGPLEKDSEIYAMYTLYASAAEERGETPLTYEEWYANLLANAKVSTCEHIYGEYKKGVNATCSSIGYEYRTCILCGDVDYRFLDNTWHAFGDWVDLISNCTEHWQMRICPICGETQLKHPEAPGHNVVDDAAVSATCIKSGLTAGSHCSVCQTVFVEQEVIAANGHQFGEDGRCATCSIVDWEDPSLNLTELCNGTYGYKYLGSMSNGVARQEVYNKIDEAVKAAHSDIETDYATDTPFAEIKFSQLNLSLDDAVAILGMYRNDNPLYYWLSNTITATMDYLYLYVDENYCQAAIRAECHSLVFDKIKEYSEYAADETSAYQIALAYHDKIISAVNYAYNEFNAPQDAKWAHNIIGVFGELGAVCESYAKTFQLLLNVRGVENIYVTGLGGSGVYRENHAWNLVRLDDGQWYWCDLTWDDKPSVGWGISYQYFCVNDTQNVVWRDGFGLGPLPDKAGFVDEHIPNTPEKSGIEFLYALPKRSTNIYSEVAQELTVRDTFEVDNRQYALAGYHTVQLTKWEGEGRVDIKETVQYCGTEYTVISIGIIKPTGEFGDGAVFFGNITALHIPKTVVFIWSEALRNTTFEEITVDRRNPLFCSVEGVLYTKHKICLIAYPNASTRTKYVVPEETCYIGSKAFEQCKYLEHLEIGKELSAVWVENYGAGYYEKTQNEVDKDDGTYKITFIMIRKGGWYDIFAALTGEATITISPQNADFVVIDNALYEKRVVIYNDDDKEVLALQAILDKDIVEFTLNEDVFDIESKGTWGNGVLIYIFNEYTNLKSIFVDENNPYFSSVGGILYDKEKANIVWVPKAIEGTVTVSDNVSRIEIDAFGSCKNLEKVILGSSVNVIDRSAFSNCSNLTSITVTKHLTSIGDYAFSDCHNLTDIYFDGTLEEWNSINKGTYWNQRVYNLTIHCTDGEIVLTTTN